MQAHCTSTESKIISPTALPRAWRPHPSTLITLDFEWYDARAPRELMVYIRQNSVIENTHEVASPPQFRPTIVSANNTRLTLPDILLKDRKGRGNMAFLPIHRGG